MYVVVISLDNVDMMPLFKQQRMGDNKQNIQQFFSNHQSDENIGE